MDELIVLLIRGIARLLGGGDAPRRPTQQAQGPTQIPNVPPAWQEQIGKAVQLAQQTPGQRKARGRRPAPPPQPVKAAAPVAAVREVAAPVAMPATARKAPLVFATSLHKWLTPDVLRRQFILTEILQPPLSMREKN